MKRSIVAMAVATALAASGGLPRTAGAGEPADDLKARARAHSDAGRRHFDLGELDQAIAEYEKAYALVPRTGLLYNLAQAHKFKGNHRTALELYRKYIAADPDGEAVDQARKDIELLEERLREQPEPAKLPAAPPPPPARPERGTPIASIVGLTVAGVGVVTVGAGAWFGLEARNLADQLSGTRTTWTDDALADFERGETSERRFIVLTAVGGVAIIAGVTTWLLARRGGEAAPVAVQLVPGGGAVVWGGQF